MGTNIAHSKRRAPTKLADASAPSFGIDIPSRSPQARQIVQSNRNAVVRATEMSNAAALVSMENQYDHQIKQEGIQLRARRAQDTMQAAGALIGTAEVLAHGNPAKHMEYLDIYNAWKQGEIYRMMTDQ